MLDGDLFFPTESKSGRIFHSLPSVYVAWVNNYVAADTQQHTGIPFWTRAYFSFDTSFIPDYAEIIYAAFKFRRRADPTGEPDTYLLKISIGTFIGAALDGNAAEWIAGTLDGSLDAKPADKDLLIFTATGRGLVNKSGETDVKVWDDSTQGGGDPTWQTNFNESVENWCKLELAWSIPSATVTGKGTAAASASVIHGGAGTGIGTGDAASTAELTAIATGTATGTGEAAGAAELTAIASGTATGTGDAAGAAELTAIAAGTATGTGEAAGIAELTAVAAGTATGVGSATCAAGFFVGPLALDARTSSVVATQSGTRAVIASHSATLECVEQDARTREPRR